MNLRPLHRTLRRGREAVLLSTPKTSNPSAATLIGPTPLTRHRPGNLPSARCTLIKSGHLNRHGGFRGRWIFAHAETINLRPLHRTLRRVREAVLLSAPKISNPSTTTIIGPTPCTGKGPRNVPNASFPRDLMLSPQAPWWVPRSVAWAVRTG